MPTLKPFAAKLARGSSLRTGTIGDRDTKKTRKFGCNYSTKTLCARLMVFRYADEIFTLGRELAESVKGQPSGRPLRLAVGVADALPKLVAYRLIEPALALPQPVRLVVHEQSTERLLAALALHELEVVLTDRVAPPGVSVRAFNHLPGDCGATLFAAPKLAVK